MGFSVPEPAGPVVDVHCSANDLRDHLRRPLALCGLEAGELVIYLREEHDSPERKPHTHDTA